MKLPKLYTDRFGGGFSLSCGWIYYRFWNNKTLIFRVHTGKPGTSALFMIWLQLWKRLAIFIWHVKVDITIR